MFKRDKFQNNSLQNNLFASYKLGCEIGCRHSLFPRTNPFQPIEKGFGRGISFSNFHWRATKSKYALYNQIVAKYAPGDMLQRAELRMVYKVLGGAFSEVHHNLSVTVPISLTFAKTVEMKPLGLWYSPVERAEIIKESLSAIGLEPNKLSKVVNLQTQIVEALPGITGDQFQFINMPFGGKRLESRETEPPNLTRVQPIYLQNTEREIVVEDSDNRREMRAHASKRIELLLGKKVVSKAMDGAVARAMPPAHFWNWLQQRRVVNISPIQSMTPMVFAQNTLLWDIISRGDDGALTSPEKAQEPRFQLAMLADTKILIQHLTEVLKLMPKGHLITGALKPIGDELLKPVINKPLVGNTVDNTGFAVADDVADEMHQLIVIRKAQQMEPPSLNYAFAQPMRPIAKEEKVITKVQEKEVVKLVQKEIQSFMSSSSVVKNFSRADYARIEDSVYSSLTRRLMIEKERLGY